MKTFIFALSFSTSISSFASDWSEYDVVTCANSTNVVRAVNESALGLLKARDQYDGSTYGLNYKKGTPELVFNNEVAEVEPKGKTTELSYTGKYFTKGFPSLTEVNVKVTVDNFCIIRGLKVTENFK